MKSCAEFFLFSIFCFSSLFSGCKKYPEMTLEEIDAFRSSASDGILSKTISKPFKDEGWKIGKNGGVWNGTISADPKSFNLLIAERDASTSGILSYLTDSLVDYNYVKREWQARLADFEISTDEKNVTL